MIDLELSDGQSTFAYKSTKPVKIKVIKQYIKQKTGKVVASVTKNGKKMDDSSEIEQTIPLQIEYKKQVCEYYLTCNIKFNIKSECSHCHKIFCGKHKLPEEHKCLELEKAKKEANLRNKNKLESEKCARSKLEFQFYRE